jgi:hypothetical protein
MKTYRGERFATGCVVTWSDGEQGGPLPLRLDLENKSPTGFEWGYGGSGPAQLALALCAHATGDDERAVRVYQSFKWMIVARLPRERWELTEAVILERVAEIERILHGPEAEDAL